eukprot:3554596-Rhodomonas_salina.2
MGYVTTRVLRLTAGQSVPLFVGDAGFLSLVPTVSCCPFATCSADIGCAALRLCGCRICSASLWTGVGGKQCEALTWRVSGASRLWGVRVFGSR